MTIVKPITWREVTKVAATELEAAGVNDPLLNAELLAAHVQNVWTRSEVRALATTRLTDQEFETYQSLIRRRIQHEPLQYITGETEFFGLRLFITPAALIPRPDTEILVEEILKQAAQYQNPRILDIGTGSGCIALAVASKLPNAEIVGIDKSEASTTLAERNRARTGFANVTFLQADIFNEADLGPLGTFDLIASNPPYIPRSEYESLDPEVRLFEPRLALTDESDGLTFYQRIFSIAPAMLNPGGTLLLEIGYGASEKVKQLAQFGRMEIIKDLSGIDRVLTISTP